MEECEATGTVRREYSSPLCAAVSGPALPLPGNYRYFTVTVEEAIELVATGVWDVPDFQREFVWKPSQVCDLADSLWCSYPIGALLLWFNSQRDADCAGGGLIADGLHRLTSLGLLFGR